MLMKIIIAIFIGIFILLCILIGYSIIEKISIDKIMKPYVDAENAKKLNYIEK